MNDRSKSNILIVEDEQIVAMDLQQTLVELGYETCGIARSADEALDQCSRKRPDIVLMDIRIKGALDGIQVAELLQNKYQISVIYLTAHADTSTLEKAKQTDPLGYLVKPVIATELHRTIEIALHRITHDIVQREHNEQLVALASNSLDSKSYIDRNYHYRYVNDAHLKLWGVRRYEVEGKPVSQLIGEEVFSTEVKPQLDRALAGELVQCQACIDFPSQGYRHVDITYIPVSNAAHSVVGVVVRTHDIDDLKRTAEQLKASKEILERKNISLERLVFTLSHDLREPVNTLVNYSELLSEGAGSSLSEPAHRYVAYLRIGSHRLRSILDDLVSFTRLGRDLQPCEPCDLNEIFDEIVSDLWHSIAKSGAVVTRSQLPTVSGRKALLRLMMQNLISNSLKFVAPSTAPIISVDATVDSEHCELRVTDNGIGIDESHREKIFDLFSRLHARNEYEGRGFGLAACRHIAELHGGRIWVNGVDPRGCCFHVTLRLRSTQCH